MNKQHNQWASKLGFIMATAGAAIGLGNLWKFPYLMGRNGGFPFLAAYLIFVCILGLPVMIMEMTLGRKTGKDPVRAFQQVHPHAKITGIFAVLSAFLILSYYSVIGGWIMKYVFSYITSGKAPENFEAFTAGPVEPVIWHFVFMAVTAGICLFGVKGIEKASKTMMPALFVILIVIIIRSVTLPGASEGLKFIFSPNGEGFSLNSVSAALGQVFYSLSLCMGITITYGRYLGKEHNIPKSCLNVAALDTTIAILAGIAIFPAVFSFQMEPGQGPGLIFGTLPKIFASLKGGIFFAILFFILILFAAVTSTIALLEVSVSFTMDQFKWPRKKAVLILAAVIFAIGIPSALSFGVLSDFKILNYTFFDFMSTMMDNIFLPVGGILMCWFIGFRWNPQFLVEEIEQNGIRFRLAKVWKFCIRFITPVLILIVTITGFAAIFEHIF